MPGWPKDYRVSLYIVLGTLAALGWAEVRMARVAAMEVAPVAARLQTHDEVQKGAEANMAGKVDRIDKRTELLIEDCWRRGGCRR